MTGKSNDRALMPPPASPSRSPRRSQSSQPRTDISNAFSETVKLEVIRMTGASCWSCATSGPQFAHVVAQKDGQVCIQYPYTFPTLANQPQGPLLDESWTIPIFIQNSGQLYSALSELSYCFRPLFGPVLGFPTDKLSVFYPVGNGRPGPTCPGGGSI